MKPINKCKNLQELFAEESRWTKETFAKDKKGEDVSYDSPMATCFCLSGGIQRVYKENRDKIYEVVDEYLAKKKVKNLKGYCTLVSYNDGGTYKRIYNLVKKLNI